MLRVLLDSLYRIGEEGSTWRNGQPRRIIWCSNVLFKTSCCLRKPYLWPLVMYWSSLSWVNPSFCLLLAAFLLVLATTPVSLVDLRFLLWRKRWSRCFWTFNCCCVLWRVHSCLARVGFCGVVFGKTKIRTPLENCTVGNESNQEHLKSSSVPGRSIFRSSSTSCKTSYFSYVNHFFTLKAKLAHIMSVAAPANFNPEEADNLEDVRYPFL